MQNLFRFLLLFIFIFFTLLTSTFATQLDGHWAGTVTQQNPEQQFNMHIILLPTSRSGVAGSWTLGNGCGGSLEQIDRTLSEISVRAFLGLDQDREGRCLDEGRMQLKLIDAHNLYFEMTYIEHTEVQIRGTLMRIGNTTTGTVAAASDRTPPPTNITKFDIDNDDDAQVFGIRMCTTQLDSVGNCLTDIYTFNRETVMVNVSYDILGEQQDNQIVAKWYKKIATDEYEYMAGKDIPLSTEGIDQQGNFFFTFGRDYPTGEYLLEIVADSGDIATKEFQIVR